MCTQLARGTFFALALLLGVGCGGSGGGGVPPPVPQPVELNGGYHVGYVGASGGLFSAWGYATADADAGVARFTVSANDGEAIVGPVGPYEQGIEVLDESLLRMYDPSPDVFFEGPILHRGDFALVGLGWDHREHGAFYALSKREAGHTNATLSGEYFLSGFVYESTGDVSTAQVGTLTFDGEGAFFGTGVENRAGVFDATVGFGVGSYDVDDAGVVSLSFGDTIPATGTLVAGGEMVLLFGSTNAAFPPGIYALVRKGAGMDAGVLQDAYYGIRIDQRGPGEPLRVFRGYLKPRGEEHSYIFYGEERRGDPDDGPVLVFEHAEDWLDLEVFEDGGVLAESPFFGPMGGGVTANGRLMTLGGYLAVGDPRAFYVLCR